jgi:hypothetical protein
MAASFEEKSVWVQLIAMVIGLGAYFVIAARMMAEGVTALPAYAGLFIAATVFMVVLLIVGHILAAVSGRVEGRDERDRIISWRAEHNSSWLLATGVLCAITAMVIGIEPVWVVHCLFASLVASEILGYLLQLVYYRRGLRGVGGV